MNCTLSCVWRRLKLFFSKITKTTLLFQIRTPHHTDSWSRVSLRPLTCFSVAYGSLFFPKTEHTIYLIISSELPIVKVYKIVQRVASLQWRLACAVAGGRAGWHAAGPATHHHTPAQPALRQPPHPTVQLCRRPAAHRYNYEFETMMSYAENFACFVDFVAAGQPSRLCGGPPPAERSDMKTLTSLGLLEGKTQRDHDP